MSRSRITSYFWMTLLRMAGLMVSYANQALVGAWFGAGALMDAFWIGTSVIFYLDTVITQSLQKVFLPRLIALRNDKEEAQRYADRFTAIFVLSLGTLAISGFLAAGAIVDLLAPSLSAQAREVAVGSLRIMVFQVLSGGLFSIAHDMQLVSGAFVRSSAANRVMGLMILAGLLLFVRPSIETPNVAIRIMATVYLVSNALMALAMIGGLRTTPFRLGWRWDFLTPDVRASLRTALPVFIAALAVQSMGLVDKWIGASLGEGCVSYLSYAQRLTQIPLILFGSLALLSFPAISARADAATELWNVTLRYYRAGLMIILPFAIVTYLGADAIVGVVYLRGKFSAEDAASSVQALRGYAPFMTMAFIGSTLMQPFYALRKTHTVMVIALFMLVLNTVCSIALARVMGFAGVAWGSSITVIAGAIVFWIALGRALGPVARFGPFLQSLGRLAVAGTAAFIPAWLLRGALERADAMHGILDYLGRLTMLTLAVFPIFVGLLWLLRYPEFAWVMERLRKRLYASRGAV